MSVLKAFFKELGGATRTFKTYTLGNLVKATTVPGVLKGSKKNLLEARQLH